MATLTLDKLRKVYPNGYEAVAGLDLEIEDGEFVVLVGPSGCGKSTVLRMVAGLEEITDGNLLLADERINDFRPQKRDMAMVFQSYALYPTMTVKENIAFAMTLRKVDKAEIERKVAEVAGVLELTEVLDRKPGQLSGGQRQRVAMGRAIVREPKLFLMDEPLSNLDAKLRVQTRAEIARLQRRLGITTMYVTHDQVEAMTMGHRVVVLRRGHLMQCASPQELYASPANLFVGQFIGSPTMNVLVATVVDHGDGVALDIGGQRIVMDDAAQRRFPGIRAWTGRQVAVGIRPEALGNDGAASLDVNVALVEVLGAEQLVHADIDAPSAHHDDDGVHVSTSSTSTIVGAIDARRHIDVGTRMTMAVDTQRLHLFDLATGDSLGAPYQPT